VIRKAHDERENDRGTAERPSKSARKRAAHAVQDLGERLVELNETELDALELPDALREALRAARRIGSRAALARQRQYIGKLMRELDPEPIRAALGARRMRAARESELFRRIDAWRERLILEGPPALAALARAHPVIDQLEWERRVNAARAERAHKGKGGGASRELFRALRTLFATMPR